MTGKTSFMKNPLSNALFSMNSVVKTSSMWIISKISSFYINPTSVSPKPCSLMFTHNLAVGMSKLKASFSFTKTSSSSSRCPSLCPLLHHPHLPHPVWNLKFNFDFVLPPISAFKMFSSFIHLFILQAFMNSCYILETVFGVEDGLTNKHLQLSVISVITEVSTDYWGRTWETHQTSPGKWGKDFQRRGCQRSRGCIGTGQEGGQVTAFQERAFSACLRSLEDSEEPLKEGGGP